MATTAAQLEGELFEPDWFKSAYDFKIKGYYINDKIFDTHSGIVEDLTISLEHYDATKPIILAKSENPEINNQVIDGRTRLYAGNRRLRKFGELPDYTFKWIKCPDRETLAALRASFELKNRSKSSEVSRAWTEYNIRLIVDSKIDVLQDKLPDYIKRTLGFNHDKIINKIYNEMKEERAKARKTKQDSKPKDIKAVIAAEREKWGIKGGNNNTISTTTTNKEDPNQYKGIASDNPNHVTSYKWSCPGCKIPLRVVTDSTTGEVISITHASGVALTK